MGGIHTTLGPLFRPYQEPQICFNNFQSTKAGLAVGIGPINAIITPNLITFLTNSCSIRSNHNQASKNVAAVRERESCGRCPRCRSCTLRRWPRDTLRSSKQKRSSRNFPTRNASQKFDRQDVVALGQLGLCYEGNTVPRGSVPRSTKGKFCVLPTRNP